MDQSIKSQDSTSNQKIITLEELLSSEQPQNESQLQTLLPNDWVLISEGSQPLKSSDEQNQKQLSRTRELLDDKWYDDDKMADIVIDIVENAEKESKVLGMVPDYRVRLQAWDRLAEMRGLITKRMDGNVSGAGWTVNLAFLLGNKQ